MDLRQIFKPVDDELDEVRKLLNIQVGEILDRHIPGSSQVEFFTDLLNRLLSNPGKMLRPVLTLLAAGIVNREVDSRDREILIPIAGGVELIHTASLVHDDIIDEASERRGKPSLNKIFNNTIAVLAGDILYAQFFTIISTLPANPAMKMKILEIFCNVSQQMCLGEIHQHRILLSGSESDKEDYLDILKNKTAVLMSACCRCGAIAGSASEEEEKAMAEFGLRFGLAFQLADDLKDGDAVFENKEEIRKLGQEQVALALQCLDVFSDSKEKTSLAELCKFLKL